MSQSEKISIAVRPDGQRGLFAGSAIARDEILLVYDGPIIDHPTRYSIQIDDGQHIDGTADSNAFLNHACEPTGYVDWDARVLRALRDLAAGEEITCNYMTTDWEFHEPFACRCGSARCYGELRGLKYLPRTRQLELVPFLPPFMRRKLGLRL